MNRKENALAKENKFSHLLKTNIDESVSTNSSSVTKTVIFSFEIIKSLPRTAH